MKIPKGWQIVPIEPTPVMLKAALHGVKVSKKVLDITNKWNREDYIAMLAVAPKPPPIECDCGRNIPTSSDELVNVAEKAATEIGKYLNGEDADLDIALEGLYSILKNVK